MRKSDTTVCTDSRRGLNRQGVCDEVLLADMMIVEIIKCDLCEKTLKPGDVKVKAEYYTGKQVHLCYDCMFKFSQWVNDSRRSMRG